MILEVRKERFYKTLHVKNLFQFPNPYTRWLFDKTTLYDVENDVASVAFPTVNGKVTHIAKTIFSCVLRFYLTFQTPHPSHVQARGRKSTKNPFMILSHKMCFSFLEGEPYSIFP